ncbi:phosphotransferase family protein [Rhodococcus ruber]|uniref:phosphotransferase family protein n=3 Tax=Rhodococcus TaxID=1827 RepID=UPI003D8160F1
MYYCITMHFDWLPRWMDERGVGAGPVTEMRSLTGGTQNVLMSFSRAGRRYVLRMPPPVKRPNSDDTMRREARVLTALGTTPVPHPHVIAAETDTAVMGSAFYLMEAVDGFVAPSGWPRGFAAEPSGMRRVGLAAAEALAVLAAVDHEKLGLADLARPGSFLERQVSRWRWQLDSYRPGPNYAGLPEHRVAAVAQWLEANRPTSESTGIVHGDYHLGNIMLADGTGEVAAIVDWELVTIGDPLLDLAQFLVCWPGAEDNSAFAEIMPVAPTAGLATEKEIIMHYAERTGRDLEALPWYKVLAAFRLGVLLEGTSVRASRGEAPADAGRQFHRASVGLIEQAHREAAACSI